MDQPHSITSNKTSVIQKSSSTEMRLIALGKVLAASLAALSLAFGLAIHQVAATVLSVMLAGLVYVCCLLAVERHRAACIQTAERLLRGVVESTPHFISISDCNGNIIFRNSAFHEFLCDGLDSSITHPRCADTYPQPAQSQFADEILPSVMREGIWSGESLLYRHDGVSVPVWQVVVAQRDGDVTRLSTIAREITLQKAVEESLRATQKAVEQITESTPCIVYIHDLAEQKTVFTNLQAAITLGYDLSDLNTPLSSMIDITVHPDDRDAVNDAVKSLLIPGFDDTISVEFRCRTKAGGWVWLSSRSTIFNRAGDGAPVQILGAALDITAQKLAERELTSDRERFSKIVALQREIMDAELDAGRVMMAVTEGALKIAEASGASIEMRGEIGSLCLAGGDMKELHCEMLAQIEQAIARCFETAEAQNINIQCGTQSSSTNPDVRSAITVPLRRESRVEGVMTVLSHNSQTFNAHTVEALQHLADLSAAALSRAAVFQSHQALLAERTAALDSLLESEERFRAAIGAVHEAMVLRDRSGKVKATNASAERILGFPVEELFQTTLTRREWSLIREDRSEFPVGSMPDLVAMETGEPQPDSVFGIEREDGTVTWLSASAAPLIHGDQTEPYGAVMTFSDISERKAIHEANARLAAIVDSSQDGILCATLEGVIVSWNPGAEQLFGYSAGEMLGRMSAVLTPPNDSAAFKSVIKKLLDGDGTELVECIRFRKDGVPVHISMTYSLIRNGAGDPIAIAAIAHDITDRARYEEQIRSQMEQINEINVELNLQKEQLVLANEQLATLATLDGLSGLKNHRYFQERLQEEFQRANRYKTPLSMFILDVDEFKAYNDAFGHPAGDEVLRTVSKLLTENCRATDVISRYGGEEFVVILPQTHREGALVIAERCREKIQSQIWPLRKITASFGVSTLTPDLDTATTLLSSADQAMYRSKGRGKNCVTHACEFEKEESGLKKAA